MTMRVQKSVSEPYVGVGKLVITTEQEAVHLTVPIAEGQEYVGRDCLYHVRFADELRVVFVVC